MSHLAEIGLGLGLAAACGFRVFLPLAVLSLAAWSGHVRLVDSLAWLGSTPAVVVLGVACAAELAAYSVPWVDNALDWLATPAALGAGIVASAAVMEGLRPEVRWTIALIAGGGVAGVFQGTTVVARKASSIVTLGTGNWILAGAEAMLALLTAVLSFLLPIVVLGLVALTAAWFVLRRRRREEPA